MVTILAAAHFANNGRIIEYCHQLGLITNDDFVLDATYGKGVWWRQYQPRYFTSNDSDLSLSTDYHYDFRKFPFKWGELFNVVTLDPPYVSPGGRKTTTIPEFHNRYGTIPVPDAPSKLHNDLVVPGILECLRVLQPGGHLFYKGKDYVSSGKLVPAAHWAYSCGIANNLILQEEFVFVNKSGGPQPTKTRSGKARRVVHARHNFSMMYVWRKVL